MLRSVRPVRPSIEIHVPVLGVALLVMSGWSAAAHAARQEESDSPIIAAELALQRGECGTASRSYATAAATRSDVRLAMRATDVALDCGQYPQAVTAAARWRSLQPADGTALLAAARAELGQAHIAEARRLWQEWLSSRTPPDDEALLKGLQETVAVSGAEATYSMLRDLQHPRLAGATAQLVLGGLAADAYDFAETLKHAQAAAKAGAKPEQVAMLRIRALAGLGNATQALTEARALARDDPDQGLADVEALLVAGRDQEAEDLLQQRREDARYSLPATRRLALLMFQQARYADAERLFAELLRDQNTVATAVYYLAVIAERRGDVDSAMKGYELLARSGFDDAARRRIAALYLRDGERTQAVRLLTPDDDAGPRERIASELAIADLLAQGVSPKEAVARLDSALAAAPGHPELSYQRAVYLERVDADAAIASLETLHRQRPQDAIVTNALGFTLADHGRDLGRAEALIRSALRTSPDNPAVLDSLGWVLQKRGKSADALPSLQRAWQLYHDGDIGAHCGEVLWSLGRKDEARAQWRTALAADPDSETLKAVAAKYAPDLSVPVPQPRNTHAGGGTSI